MCVCASTRAHVCLYPNFDLLTKIYVKDKEDPQHVKLLSQQVCHVHNGDNIKIT